ncbi:pyruvate dehydrogenase (acetyl-transferring), homodimeric type [Wohlfahrtiimonas chitiniclastica]|nr:pyruvate dehydrogenase (acetyl-transferring), homodimeric type [Wohlfahrtiimonas chitiniclastica]
MGVDADIYGCPSFNILARDVQDTERHNMLHPLEKPRVSHVAELLNDSEAPVVAASDYIRLFGDQIRAAIKAPYKVLGTDGFGRSDTRGKLREFFEVNRYYVTVAALKELADQGVIEPSVVVDAINKYGIDVHKKNPITL